MPALIKSQHQRFEGFLLHLSKLLRSDTGLSVGVVFPSFVFGAAHE